MKQQREEEQLVWGKSASNKNDDAGAASCLSPAASAAAAPFPRHALEEELLHRADLQLQGATGGRSGGDRRRERKIKNRESAARSRARRYAYVNELEKEASCLREENEQLRKLCEELKEAAEAPVPVKRRSPLQRTSSAPF